MSSDDVSDDVSDVLGDDPPSAGEDDSKTLISKQLWTHAGLSLLVIGTIGHAMSVLVLLGSRRMRSLSLTVFVVSSSLAGMMALYAGLLRQILRHLDGYQADVREQTTDAGCRVHTALTYFSLQLFSWLQASVAIERVIAVCRPLQYKRWCTRQHNLIVVAVVAILLASLNVMVIVWYRFDKHKGRCYSYDEYLFDKVWGSFDLVLSAIVPIAVIIPCNAVTIYFIYKTNACRRSTNPATSARKARQFTIMLLVYNILCVVTTLPIAVIFLVPWPADDSPERSVMELQWTACSLFHYLGTTLGFTVYSVLAQKFRKAISELFCKGFNAKASSTDSNTASAKSSRQSEIGSTLRQRTCHSIDRSALPRPSQTTQIDEKCPMVSAPAPLL